MTEARACAKINLALVVGPLRRDGKHEVATVLQRIDLADRVQLEASADGSITVEGFDDTIVGDALAALADAAGAGEGWHVRLEKRIPVAAGLGGGSADAAAALALANASLSNPLDAASLHGLAARIGADLPFFLTEGPQLGAGDGSELSPLHVPTDYWVLLALPEGAVKESTAAVYDRFDAGRGADGFEARRAALSAALDRVRGARDLAELPRNDLASSSLAAELERRGSFRADVSGAGPAVYALFERRQDAARAARGLRGARSTWISRPVR